MKSPNKGNFEILKKFLSPLSSSCRILILFIVLISLPLFACRRTVSNESELTRIAEIIQKTAALRQTMFPEKEIQQKTDSSIPSKKITASLEPSLTPEVFTFSSKITQTPAYNFANQVTITSQAETVSPDTSQRNTTVPGKELNTAVPEVQALNLPELKSSESEMILYETQNGDMLDSIAYRFGTSASRIVSSEKIKSSGFLKAGIPMLIPQKKRAYCSSEKIIPDEYVSFSKTALSFDYTAEIEKAGGYLSGYTEEISEGKKSGIEILKKVSLDYSINPLLLMALLEYKSHWIYEAPDTIAEQDYPVGWIDESSKGLYKQLSWAAQQLSKGYYGWRYSKISEIPYYKSPKPEQTIYFEPSLNAGSVAVQYLFSQIAPYSDINEDIFGGNGFLQTFYNMYGNIWDGYEPDPNGLNDQLSQIELQLPFAENEKWSLTGGPHESWTTGSPLGALDLAPMASQHGCASSNHWVEAAAAGKVIRTGVGTVVVDMDGDGNEETGWVMLYLHIATKEKVAAETELKQGDHIGHPSCEGGLATGTHVHIARKYNGEWIPADGPIPFKLSGWTAYEGKTAYTGGLYRGNQQVIAESFGSSESLIGY